jgi:glycosyltransferase involved in cell wall biosynthesis
MGLPTITTRQNGAAEVIEDSRHGYVLSDPGDVGGLASAMRKLLDAGLRASQREACLSLRPRLSYERHLDQLQTLYRRVRAAS